MPILGALFRSRDFQNNETELVVIVTAYLVTPTTEAKLAAPTDGFLPPTDPETIFAWQAETRRIRAASLRRPKPKARSDSSCNRKTRK